MIFFYYLIAFLFFVASLYISIYSFEQFYLFVCANRKKDTIPQETPLTTFPFVTIQLSLYNECFVVEDLIRCITRLDYPADKLEIQILDDSTDHTTTIIQNLLKELPGNQPQIIHIHRTNREGYKAGALKNGLLTARGEFIALFDADFRPEPDFLIRTLPAFAQQNIAAVQTRWGYLNEDQNFITKVQGILINNHFLVEQKGRYEEDLLLQFSGTGGIWRKSAIIDAGGWQSDTIVEDVDLSFRAQLSGWKIVLRSDIVCPAELPNDANAVKVQQFRWMQGGAEICRKYLWSIVTSDLSLKKKFHAAMHLTTVYVYLSIFLTALLSLPMLYSIQELGINPAWLGLLSMGFLLIVVVLFFPNYQTGWKHLPKKQRMARFIMLCPAIVVSGMAISFHNSVAIFKGTFGLKTPFIRTPKYNSGNNGTTHPKAKTKTYHIKASWIAYAELLLVFYFAGALIWGIYIKNYLFVPYHFALVIVFSVISFLSLGLNKKACFN